MDFTPPPAESGDTFSPPPTAIDFSPPSPASASDRKAQLEHELEQARSRGELIGHVSGILNYIQGATEASRHPISTMLDVPAEVGEAVGLIKPGTLPRTVPNAPLVTIPKPSGESLVAGIARGAIGLVEGIETPENLPFLALGNVGPGVQRAALTTIAGKMATDIPEVASKAGEVSVTGTPAQKGESAVQLAAATILPAAIATGFTLGKEVPKGRVVPTPEESARDVVPAHSKIDLPPEGQSTGLASTSTGPFFTAWKALSDNISTVSEKIRNAWRSSAMQGLPKITEASHEVGEQGVRAASARLVGRTLGELFATKVLKDLELDDVKLGTAGLEDNLRSIKESRIQQSNDYLAKGDPENAALMQTAADAIPSYIGREGSPFQDEQSYQDFLSDPETLVAINRHKQLWAEQKDPLFRQAMDLDPDTSLPTRGMQTGMRLNLMRKSVEPGDVIPLSGTGLMRQLATLKRVNPFGKMATGLGENYETSYTEMMRNGFGRELPVAAQHEFIKQMIDSGNAKMSDRIKSNELDADEWHGFPVHLGPWRGKFIQVKKSLANDYAAAMGLQESSRIPYFTSASEVLTRQSIQGFAEGSQHVGNLLSEIFTGIGPTANPLVNVLIKSLGRSDLLYRIPKVFVEAFKKNDEEMARLMTEGAAKPPYKGAISSKIINPVDRGVRIVSSDLYRAMAKEGWVVDTITGEREFVNQVGNYNKQLQPKLIRFLRESGFQPFATAIHNFNVQALRRLGMGPGAKSTSALSALALRADILSGWVGFVVLTKGIQSLVNMSRNAQTPPGTHWGAVGWKGDDGKTHELNLAALSGYDRGLRITGLGQLVEGEMRGVSPNIALKSGSESMANSALNYINGPMVRTLMLASSGTKLGVPPVQIAPKIEPHTEFNLIRNQVSANIATAVKEANPLLSSAVDMATTFRNAPTFGKTGVEALEQAIPKIVQKQVTRYSPRTLSSVQSSERFAGIIRRANLNDFSDYVAKEARKLPIGDRPDYIKSQMEHVEPQDRDAFIKEIRRKSVYRK